RAAQRKDVLDDALDLVRWKPDDRGHSALRATRRGEATPLGHEAQGVLERENAGRHERGEFTERVAGHEPGSEIGGEGRDATRLDTVARAAAEPHCVGTLTHIPLHSTCSESTAIRPA